MPDNFTPFKNIGLCFSGGGYRATFFSLGTAAYLNTLKYEGAPLLKNVIAISTVSGGSLFGIAFAKAVASPNFDFPSFYKQMYQTFEPSNDTLLTDAVAKLSTKKVWSSQLHKRQSLINAFALQYAEMPLFSGTFDALNFDPNKENAYRLAHVCFNATEFSFGLPFRFQNTGVFGNNPLNNASLNTLKNETVLGDIVAASSCFPLGFEPLVFPDDFYCDQYSEAYINLKKQDAFKNGIGIMDGGITDNQGIDSMLNVTSRKASKLDLIIVNDVASFKMDAWKPADVEIANETSLNDTASNILRWLDVKRLYWLIAFVGVFSIGMGVLLTSGSVIEASLFIVGGIVLGIGTLLIFIGFKAKTYKKQVMLWFNKVFNKAVPTVLIEEVSSFKHLGVDLVKHLLSDRASAATTMVQNVFLNQIRRLNYNDFYKNPNLENKRITSRVDELDGKDTIYKKFKIPPEINTPLSEALKNVANIAAETPTSLWWDETDVKLNRMDSLIACGQFTTCYNLLTYIIDLKKELVVSPEIEALEKQLRSDWKLFNENPFRLV